MVYRVTNRDAVDYHFGETDPVKSILQNISLILNTQAGTCPMYREFGLPNEWVDRQVPIAEVVAAQEVTEAIETLEPRVTLRDVHVEGDLQTGKMYIYVEVEL